MERRDEDPAVDQVQVQGHLQAVMKRRLGLRAGFGGRGTELELAACAQLRHRPVQAVLFKHFPQPLGQIGCQRQDVLVGLFSHDLLQIGAHAMHGQGIG